MVKNPPCHQYPGPHLSYQRNGKTYCRKKKGSGTFSKKKTPPCHQYYGKHLLYVRNGKTYCRRVNPKNLTNEKELKGDVFHKCLRLDQQKLNDYAGLLNIDVREKENTDICWQISKLLTNDSRKIATGSIDYKDTKGSSKISELLTNHSRKILTTNIYYQTKPEDVKHISQLLNISLKDSSGHSKNMDQLLLDICEHITKRSSKKMRSLLEDLYPGKIICSKETGYIITKIIKNILYPQKFPKKSPILITKELNQKLISLKKRKVLSNTTEQELLKETLHTKLCHCIKSMLVTNKFKKEVLNKRSQYNPYAICTQSVYKNRGFPVPKKSVRKCPKNYEWYQKLDYITGRKKKKSLKKKQQKNKDSKKHQGGNISENCSQSLEKVEMMSWPNIYANADGWKGSGWA